MHHCGESIFKVDYLREYESIFETALAHESVDPGVLFDEKQRSKISWDCHFKKKIVKRCFAHRNAKQRLRKLEHKIFNDYEN
jgi:hypothetical protein